MSAPTWSAASAPVASAEPSARTHPSVRRSPVDALQAPAEMPSALSRPPARADMQVASCSRPAHHRARHRHIIPIALAASQRPTARDFVPWRFLDAGSLSMRRLSLLPASKNLHNSGNGPMCSAQGIFGERLAPPSARRVRSCRIRKESGRSWPPCLGLRGDAAGNFFTSYATSRICLRYARQCRTLSSASRPGCRKTPEAWARPPSGRQACFPPSFRRKPFDPAL